MVRADLAMAPGKLAAQAGHAFLDAYLQSRQLDPPRAEVYRDPTHGTKVVLVVSSLEQLHDVAARCAARGLPHVYVVDAGHVLPPHFDGTPIITALGVGPARRDEVRGVTSNLPLLR